MPPRVRSPKSSVSASDVDAAHAAVVTTKRTRKVKATVGVQQSARLGLLSGLIEGTLVMMELIFGLTFTKAACMWVYKSVNGLSSEQEPPAWNSFCMTLASNLIMVSWLIFRLSQKSLPVCGLAEMADRLHLWPLRAPARSTWSSLALVFSLHFVGTLGMVAAQYLSGKWIFGWSNYFDEQGEWDYSNSIDMLLLAPAREELTFRGLMFAIFYLRGAAFKLAPPAPAPAVNDEAVSSSSSSSAAAPSELLRRSLNSDPSAAAAAPAAAENLAWTGSWKLDCVIASAVTFGVVHLLNLFGARYTRTYILLQVFLGMTLGSFYCFRFVLSDDSMLETILLHAINNAFSSFLPVQEELDLSSPLVSLPRQEQQRTCARELCAHSR